MFGAAAAILAPISSVAASTDDVAVRLLVLTRLLSEKECVSADAHVCIDWGDVAEVEGTNKRAIEQAAPSGVHVFPRESCTVGDANIRVGAKEASLITVRHTQWRDDTHASVDAACRIGQLQETFVVGVEYVNGKWLAYVATRATT